MPYLNGVLNVAALLAIVQAIVKLLDIALDTRQKLIFQRFINKVTLWLIDRDPIRHYRRFSERKVQLTWFVCVVLLVQCLFVYLVFDDYNYDFQSWWHDREIRFQGWSIVSFFLFPVLIYVPFRVVLSWLARSKTAGVMLLKASGLALISGVAFMAIDRYATFTPSVATLPFAWIFGAIFDTFILGAAIVVALYLAQAVVWLFSRLMWRIATDTKGAWSAVLFVSAGILGLAAVLVREP